MKTNEPKTIYLKDYTPSDYSIDQVNLDFDIFDEFTIVTSILEMNQHTKGVLELDGVELEIIELAIDSDILKNTDYEYKDHKLKISADKIKNSNFKLKTKVKIYPDKNTELEGLYRSGSILCTQNEPEGFRRITFYIDRPDIMARFETRIAASKSKYKYLLSNGNKIDSGDLEGGRHFAVWEDPFKKPSYLFAAVAGNLGLVADEYTTLTGKKKAIEIYCDPGNEDRCYFAIEALKNSMLWDEKRWGLEYDLDIYMIVAVDSFNMGAMENKGLNIFNSSCVLADKKSATDQDFEIVEAVVGHEYFHNWTGNRVTCRDWFQLTLKEGLTVFRDQEFSADMQVRSVKRIEDVKHLKNSQFAEDQGPMAHPIRPQSYIEINNFYTLTIYEKGAEVIRMIHTILGEEKFRKGMDRYFELFDGMAVTTDDFVRSMEEASGEDLTQFKSTWYNYPGTPEVLVKKNNDGGEFQLTITQRPSSFVKSEINTPYYMPFIISLYDAKGSRLHTEKLILKDETTTFQFKSNLDLVPSLNEGFSAPVRVNYEYSENELSTLMGNCEDEFNRYDMGQIYSKKVISKLVDTLRAGGELDESLVPAGYLDSYENILKDEKCNLTFKSYALGLPRLEELVGEQNPIDIDNTYNAYEWLNKTLAKRFESNFRSEYERCQQWIEKKGNYEFSSEDNSYRALKNKCLSMLGLLEDQEYFKLAMDAYKSSDNMTDRIAAFKVLCDFGGEEFENVSNDFYEQCKEDNLIFNKWLTCIAGCKRDGAIERAEQLMNNPSFDIKVPNHVRSVIRGFASNFKALHKGDASGYKFIADFIAKYDKVNPTIASGITQVFDKSSRLDMIRKDKVKTLLDQLKTNELSKNTTERIDKIIASLK